MSRQVKSGAGWRLGWDPNASEFNGLIGGEDWALELTAAELDDFCRLVAQLSQTMSQMANELMEEEAIACEAESDLLWLEVQGYPQAYSLHCMLLTGRGGEGSWPAPVVPDLIQAAQTLRVF